MWIYAIITSLGLLCDDINVDKYIIKLVRMYILVLFSFAKMFPNTVKSSGQNDRSSSY